MSETATQDVLDSEFLDEAAQDRPIEPSSDRPEGSAAASADEPDSEPLADLSWRIAIAISLPVVSAAIMVGGIFKGASPRVYAVVAGLLGIALAAGLARMRKPLIVMLLNVVGMFLIGLLMAAPSGMDHVFNIGDAIAASRGGGDLLRPPVPIDPGWQAIIGWLMALLSFTTGWVAFVIRRPTTALLLPLPIAAIAGISVPENQQVPSGIVVLVLFALSMGLLSSSTAVGEDDDERPPLAYEVRRTLKSLPMLALLTGALIALSQAGFLFPDSLIDPTKEPQKPKTVPLSEVEDRVLFAMSELEPEGLSGPWRTGSLDVFDGVTWRLPPFAENELDEVPESGVVDDSLQTGAVATIEVFGLTGAVLPTLPNPNGIIAQGPKLSYDPRNGNIRVTEGTVEPGLKYTVTAAGLPSVDDLRNLTGEVPAEIVQFTEIPPPPASIQDLIAQAPTTSKWDQFDFLRLHVLDNVTVSGPGLPVDITPERAAEILLLKEGTPFEIVALQAMLARWIDLPSRIGFGFDGGELQDSGILEVRPKHGATFVEVYFPTYKWLPVIGTPKNAKPSLGNEGELNFDPNILPSNDISVQLFLPLAVNPPSPFVKQLRQIVLIAVPIILFVLLVYFTYPVLAKARLRSRRRRAAIAAGPRARIALAYAEFRDLCTDYGYRHHSDTPLMFLDRFVQDEEHGEFAWLITRALWGDLDNKLTSDHAAAAEELSRTLRRRLGQAQPGSMRAVAAISRLSLKHPYAPETDLSGRRPKARKKREAQPVPA